MVLLIRGRIRPETQSPINRLLIALYAPVVRGVLRFRKTTIALAIVALIITIPAYTRLGSEFMPPLNEGMIFYMPTRSEEHTSELQSLRHLVCRLLLEKKKKIVYLILVYRSAAC